MKADRMLAVLLLLRVRERVRIAELAERLEVSERTVQRDVEALSTAGVPVYTERGRGGGVRMLPGFRTDVSGLTADEARALFVPVTGNAHGQLGLGKALDSALRKVLSALPEIHRPAAEHTGSRVLVDPDRWMSEAEEVPELERLRAAVFAERKLRISYRHSGRPHPQEYTVDPYGLVSKAGVWYLVADHDASPVLLRAERIRAVEVTEHPVRRRDVELGEVWETLRRRVQHPPERLRVRARMRAGRLDMARRIVGSRLSVPRAPSPEQEWVEVELSCTALGAVRQLLQFGGDVEVLTPTEARAEMARAARELTTLYEMD
ncbi:helix-turn-helix transcriptional regulator [Actinopolyspora mortivallis]|uniref:DNA-binding transcriptional regulator n=1 Tax=Actinopolyspora mortivallis TaxID=33906 RepID=A0A2T0GTR0_ACTMO|nr:WYL domain-containing protein [Actinopolyspora mortivallis]PRW62505.1 DNA-binding transcriptional regulator [Actinopolyspora mortivallis]